MIISRVLADGILVGHLHGVLYGGLSDKSGVGRLDEAWRLFRVVIRVHCNCIFVVPFGNNVY